MCGWLVVLSVKHSEVKVPENTEQEKNMTRCTVQMSKHTLIKPSYFPPCPLNLPFFSPPPLCPNFPSSCTSLSYPFPFLCFLSYAFCLPLSTSLIPLLSSPPPVCVPHCRSRQRRTMQTSCKCWLATSWMWSSIMKTTGGSG